jgi:hypothetical protein
MKLEGTYTYLVAGLLAMTGESLVRGVINFTNSDSFIKDLLIRKGK